MAQKTPTLSVVINTKNSAATLKGCLESVKGLADEIIVMDMKSQDNTRDIAKRYGATVFLHPDVGYVEPARNAALRKAHSEWVLIVDADEEIPPTLSRKIRNDLITTERIDAYFLPRKNMIFGKWVKTGWWPDHILRLFRKGKVTWLDEIHSIPQITGEVARVEANEKWAIVHHNYQSVDQFIDRAQRYAKITAEMRIKKKQPIEDPAGVFFDELVRRFYTWGGSMDGTHGRMLSILQGCTRVLESAQQWEMKHFPEQKYRPLSSVLRQAASDARFWEMKMKAEQSSGLMKLFYKIRQKLRT